MSVPDLTAWGDADASRARVALGTTLRQDLLRAVGTDRTLWRLLHEGDPVARVEVERSLSVRTVRAAVEAGLLLDLAGTGFVRSTACVLQVRITPDLETWVACDFPWDDPPGEHVAGPGRATFTLIDAIVLPDHAQVVVDLGTGCGVLGLVLAARTPAAEVVVTDLNPRALAYAELTAALGGRAFRPVLGDFLAAVPDLRPDLIVGNPPFVLGNPDRAYTYRDAYGPDQAADLAAACGRRLARGGIAQLLAGWVYRGPDDDPMRRIADVVPGCDVLVLERAIVAPERYTEVWVPDAPDRQQRWAANLRAAGVVALGTGLVTLRRSEHPSPARHVARVTESSESALAPAITEWLDTLTVL